MSEKMKELIHLLYVGRLTQFGKRELVKLIEQLQKENEELKKFIIEGITIEPNSPYKNYRLDFLRENFIPVQKLKDKIETLQELLESEEK